MENLILLFSYIFGSQSNQEIHKTTLVSLSLFLVCSSFQPIRYLKNSGGAVETTKFSEKILNFKRFSYKTMTALLIRFTPSPKTFRKTVPMKVIETRKVAKFQIMIACGSCFLTNNLVATSPAANATPNAVCSLTQ